MLSFSPIVFVNGVEDAPISPLDRGFAYGDGVFETMAMRGGHLPLLKWHYRRLRHSCDRLGIKFDQLELEQQLAQVLFAASQQDITDAVVKLIVTRGVGGRGYAIPDVGETTFCIIIVPPPENFLKTNKTALNLFLCEHRLGRNKHLAGLKHLNKLEYVLARAEWQDENFSEGLLRDSQDWVVEGTSSNVFIVVDKVLLTPLVNHCGVAGVMRNCIIEHLAPSIARDVKELELTLDDIKQADEIFMCNSVMGIRPVESLEDCRWGSGLVTQELQQGLASLLAAKL